MLSNPKTTTNQIVKYIRITNQMSKRK